MKNLATQFEQPPYTVLSNYYDNGWGDFALKYVPLLLGMLEEARRNSIKMLDVCCGTGLLVKAMGERGFDVTGIDRSLEMIEIARKRCNGIPTAHFSICEMSQLKCESEFDLITCTYDSINYLLEVEDLLQFFNRVAAALKPEGKFVFDSNTTYSYLSWSQKEFKEIPREIDGVRFRQLIKFVPDISRAEIRFEFSENVTESHFQRPWDERQLLDILSRSGLNTIWVKGSLESAPVTEVSRRIFLLTGKRDNFRFP